MKAKEASVTKFLQATQQFRIPIYQRTYSWTEKQCEQLWDDITDVAVKEGVLSHFIGSIVYIEARPFQSSAVSHLQVIDGQQRLTTLTLLLAALARAIGEDGGSETSSKKIQNYYLFNSEETGEDRYKLVLTRSDRDTLSAIIEKRQIPNKHSENLVNNFKYFQNKIAKGGFDLDTIWRGIRKLAMVDISLDADDKPQIIFESLNSTGLDLSKTDLIRNYLLMGLEPDKQEQIYTNFWHPLEEGFKEDPQEFDNFMKDYLTIKTGQIPVIRDVYPVFKEYAQRQPIEELVADIHYLAKFYTRLAFEDEQDAELNQIIHNINVLKIDAPYPFLIETYADCTDRDGNLIPKDSKNEILEIFSMVESYIFRRAICDIPTNSLGKTFASLADRIDKTRRVESLKAAFHLMSGYRRLPTDKEFEGRLISKDVYNTVRIRKHLLYRLENPDRKEKITDDRYTIEHIMPQNENLSQEWKDMLGPDWKDVHEEYLHTLGNLTLTKYNSEMSDKPFLKKRQVFADSPVRLNDGLGKLERWGKSEILERGRSLAKKATDVWKYPHLPPEILGKYTKMDEDDDPEDDDHPEPRWEYKLERASTQVQSNIGSLVSQIHQRFDCVEESYSKWLMFYVRKPPERKTMFALLGCGRNTANIMFRIDPDTFKAGENTRKVAGWFFPTGTERRIKLTAETIPEIMANLEHAHEATLRALDIRRDR